MDHFKHQLPDTQESIAGPGGLGAAAGADCAAEAGFSAVHTPTPDTASPSSGDPSRPLTTIQTLSDLHRACAERAGCTVVELSQHPRQARRALKKSARLQTAKLAWGPRFTAADEAKRALHWKEGDYRKVRAAVMSPQAAKSLLYQLPSDQAAALAYEADYRTPKGRRAIALVYALHRLRHRGRFVLGYALGLLRKVLADPNNPNYRAENAYRPSRRTLSTDLTMLQEGGVLRRWQVPTEVAEPCEMLRGATRPTNRYYLPATHSAASFGALAALLGDSLEGFEARIRPAPGPEVAPEEAMESPEEIRALLSACVSPQGEARPPPS